MIQPTYQYLILTFLSQRMRYRIYKTLGTGIISSPIFPPSLINIHIPISVRLQYKPHTRSFLCLTSQAYRDMQMDVKLISHQLIYFPKMVSFSWLLGCISKLYLKLTAKTSMWSLINGMKCWRNWASNDQSQFPFWKSYSVHCPPWKDVFCYTKVYKN